MLKAIFSIIISISFIFGDNLKSPSEFLGYELGDNFTYHHRVVSYFQHVADAVPNIKIIPYGQTYEQRPLLVAVISSQENINDIENLK